MAALHFPAQKHPRFPSNRPWKRFCSLSAVAEIFCSKMSVWSCVKEKRSEQERQGVWLAFSSQFIAGDVSEDNRWQLCKPLNPTSKDDKMVGNVWQFDRLKWVAVIRRGLSLIWNSKKFVESLFTHCYSTFSYFKINSSVSQHSNTEYSHPMVSDLSWFKVKVFSTGTNSTPHLHDAKLPHLSAAAWTAGSWL